MTLTTLLLLACNGDEPKSDDTAPPADQEDTEVPAGDDSGDAGGDTDPGPDDTAPDTAPPDTAPPDTGDTGDTGEPPEASTCSDGSEAVAWIEGGTGGDWGSVLGDFTVDTRAGAWTLSDHYTGCENLVFFNYADGYSLGSLYGSGFGDFLEALPPETHVFLTSFEQSQSAIDEDLDTMEVFVEVGMLGMDKADQAHWLDRVHYVTETAWDVGGGVGTFYQDVGGYFYLGMDRHQELRGFGYLADPLTGWATYDLMYAAYEPVYWNFEVRQEQDLEEEEATVVRIFDAQVISDTGWAGQRGEADVDLPTAKEMAGFDTLELDLTLDCADFEDCGEWDYLVYAYLCEEGDDDDCRQIGRFITTYWRPGRWVVDATPFLALMKEGGNRHFEFYTTQAYTVTLDARFSNRGKGYRPSALHPLWTGGTFDADYNSNQADVSFDVPKDAAGVDLWMVISGHGYASDEASCGEFCNHQHEVTLGSGDQWFHEYPEAGTAYGCMDQVADGVVPNQGGTWVYGRGGWCPGLEVEPWVEDLSTGITFGAENTLSYRGLLDGAERTIESTDGRIEVTSYAVVHEAM